MDMAPNIKNLMCSKLNDRKQTIQISNSFSSGKSADQC